MAKSPLLSARDAANPASPTSAHDGVTTGDPAKDGFTKIATKSASTPATSNREVETTNDNSGYGAGQFQDGTSLKSYSEQGPRGVPGTQAFGK